MRKAENVCITYLDESWMTDSTTKEQFYTIVSITSLKENYISNIESKWSELRRKYNINNGINIHFTDVKYLLNENPRKPYKQEWVEIFKDNEGQIDRQKVYQFFSDVIKVLGEIDFSIHITGIKINKEHIIRKQGNWLKNRSYQPPYLAFKAHLNLMVPYLLKLNTTNQLDIDKKSNWLSTKLRYDGDIGLGERQDLKEAYHHAITLGTKHFRPEIINELYDEIRFIGKEEVSTDNEITHAGSEIVDFIATIVACELWQREMHRTVITHRDLPTLKPLEILDPKVIRGQRILDSSS